MKNIYAVGNTHFDPVWLWKWEEAMASIHSTFRSALDRMNEDKEFIYSFATPPVFEWIKQVDPDMLEEIKARVREGRWELCEGWWLQPDCFSACGESYARQSLYGQKYLMDNFGAYADTVFNVDAFGHNAAIPQILQKSHISYYCMCRPEKHHLRLTSPYFSWESKDGSRVRAFRVGEYTEIYNKNMRKAVEKTEGFLESSDCDELLLYGVTNHGGAPTKMAIADIHTLDAEKPYSVKCSSVREYFLSQSEPSAVVFGEMITGDFGPYTNNHEIKRRNRLAEYAALNAEKASLIAKKLLRRPYPKEKLQDVWKDILFNQFLDILGGASIKEAYFDAYNGLGRAILTSEEISQFALQSVTRKVKMPGKNPDNPWNIVVWNLNDKGFDGYIEAEVQWLHEFPAYKGGILLVDGEGKEYSTQIILERSVIAGFRSRFVFKAQIPACGYKCFKVVQTGEKVRRVSETQAERLQTSAFDIEFDKLTGFISRVHAKKTGKTYTDIFHPEVLKDEGDTWCFNTTAYGKKIGEFSLKEIIVTESGAHRTTVKTTHSFRQSRIQFYYTFYSDTDYFDVRYVVNWNEKHAVLKFNSHVACSTLKVSSPFGVEERGDTCADMPMGKWLCAEEESTGVAFIADALFSYTKQGDKVSLSALRSCIYGDLRLCELDGTADYPIMEQGVTEGRLRAVLYEGDFVSRGLEDEATAFNNPPIVISEANHDGIYPSADSFMELRSESAFVSAWKESESDEGEIFRLYENAGRAQSVRLKHFGKTYDISLMPYEIKTLRIEDDTLSETFITEERAN